MLQRHGPVARATKLGPSCDPALFWDPIGHFSTSRVIKPPWLRLEGGIGASLDDLERLVTETGPAVWQTLCRTLGPSTPGADDCFQDTFLEYMRLSQSTVIHSPAAMLKRIAV